MEYSPEFIKKLKACDNRAFKQLYSETKPSLFSFIRFKVRGDYHLAEDILSEVYMDAMLYVSTLTHTHNVLAWLYRIARSKIVDHIRKMEREKRLFKTQKMNATQKNILNMFTDQAISQVLDKEDEFILNIGFSRLPPEYREILKIKYINEKSVVEIAKKTKKTKRSIEAILYRGKRLLAKEVKKALHEKIYFIGGGGKDYAGESE